MYDFDLLPQRRNSDSVKWNETPEDAVPMWVADMDFKSAPPIVEALQDRVEHQYYGYPGDVGAFLNPLIVAHYEKLYQVKVDPEWIVWVPSVISGVVASLQMTGGTFMYSVPMYDHIRALTREAKMPVIEVPLNKDENSRYSMNIEALEAAVTPEVKSLILCNPHNPVGRMYDRDELAELQAFCKKHHLLLISDEIHCELALSRKHIPFFSVNDEAGEYSVTLSSAGKICNIPGLPLGFAIIPNPELRAKLVSQQDGLLPSGNVLTMAAYEKAYDGSCDAWKEELREYLRGNRDLLEQRIAAIPEITIPHNEGTYLCWMDCSALGLENPSEFFLNEAHVKFSDGIIYGNRQNIRLNFGCPRAQLIEALDRVEAAIVRLRK